MKSKMKIAISILAAGLCMTAAAFPAAASHRQVQGKQLPVASSAAAEAIVQEGVKGLAVAVGRRGKVISHAEFGEIEPATRLPIASASKWLTGALVMQLVGEGKLSLDAPISTWLPDSPPESGKVTLRHILSQTSGVGGGNRATQGLEMAQNHRLTLGQSAAELLKVPLTNKPGEVFTYGGPGFQVAGAVVEAVTGKTWAEAFQERIALPLSMNNTYWTQVEGGLPSLEVVAETRNPTLQGGAVSTIGDYMNFLAMLADGGRYKGKQVIARSAVEALLSDQTAHAAMAPLGVSIIDSSHYALGNWCDHWNSAGRCTRSSSLGAWGVYPWIDMQSGLYGIIFMYERENAFRFLPNFKFITQSLILANR